MKKRKRNMLLLAGIASTGFGITGAVPSYLKEMLGIAVFSTFLLVGGLILIAIAFGD